MNDLAWDTTKELVLDGELTLKDNGISATTKHSKLATRIINSDSLYKTEICYIVFDVLPTQEFETWESVDGYRQAYYAK